MKKFLAIISFLILSVLGTANAAAAELKFFEFAPDIADSLTVSVVETPYQVFTPYDDYISGFDFWMENTGASGSVSFILLDQNNNSLALKSVTVSNTGAVWGGKKFHIQLSQPIKVESFNKYKIKISGSLPKLKLYYAALVQLLEHNADYSLDKNISPAILGSTEQDFAFKFALYEDSDVSAPLILNVTSTVISQDRAKIFFNTNEPVDYKVDNTSFYGNYFKCQINICDLEFSISPNAAYNYRLTVKDVWGNESYYDGSVGSSDSSVATSTATSTGQTSTSTPPETVVKDITPPIISDIQIISLESKKIKIGWKTDEAANSSLLVGLDIGGGQVITSIGDSTYELEHVLETDSVLSPEIKYYASITSIDSSGNSAVSTINFTTPKTSSVNNLLPENNESQNLNIVALANNGEESSINIGWQASSVEPANGYRIDIFNGNKKLVKQVFVNSGIYRAIADGLPAGDYYAIVYKNNNGVFEKIAKPTDFNVAQTPLVKKSFFFWYLLVFFAAIISTAIVSVFVIKRKKSAIAGNGFTLIEFMVAIGIFVIIILAVGVFWNYITKMGIFFFNNLSAQQEINQTFSEMILENRSLGSSSTGSYAIALASTSAYTFYSDIDSDGLYERVRYFFQNNILKKGVIKPTGSPLTYNDANETVSEAVRNLDPAFQNIFSYYSSNAVEGDNPMSYPVDVLSVKMIKAKLVVKPQNQNSTSSFSIFITPRNLKDL
ncbi:prepilin-type N-terminal cleavage/methylation domain-containing protein [Candidatus Wolfebacteria bacterium]|nr:prepilin-type N-terminal cleavage/methylation domain-containing protein [Candidatus Wolfebacteria bacterium]